MEEIEDHLPWIEAPLPWIAIPMDATTLVEGLLHLATTIGIAVATTTGVEEDSTTAVATTIEGTFEIEDAGIRFIAVLLPFAAATDDPPTG